MKNGLILSLLVLIVSTSAYAQKISPAELIGTWDQDGDKHPGTIQFVDSNRVRYSYKGRTGTTRDYYYALNNANTPSVLTVDYSLKRKKHRNEYLVEFVDKNTLKIQVLYKKDSREHFSNDPKNKPIQLLRRMDL
jgi:hypothetical protein